jgi:hypothetical protein
MTEREPDGASRGLRAFPLHLSKGMELLAEHVPHELHLWHLGQITDKHRMAVAHDCDPVANDVELIEPVTDEQIDTPDALSARTVSNSTATSRSSSEEVGSSMITSFAFWITARAIATIWRVAALNWPTGLSTSMASLKLASTSLALARIVARSRKPQRRGSRAMKMFSATERCGARLIS